MLVLEWKKSGKELFFSPSVRFCGIVLLAAGLKSTFTLVVFILYFCFFSKESTLSQRFFRFSYKQNINVISSFS